MGTTSKSATFYVDKLPEKQQEMMIAARRIQQAGGRVKADTLAIETEGNSESPTLNRVRGIITSLRQKGCWAWDNDGGVMAAGDMPYTLIWPGEGTAGGYGGGGKGDSAYGIARREFCLAVNGAMRDLPHDVQIDIYPQVKALTDAVMGS